MKTVWRVGCSWAKGGGSQNGIYDIFFRLGIIFSGDTDRKTSQEYYRDVREGDYFSLTTGAKVVGVGIIKSNPATLKELGFSLADKNLFSSDIYKDFPVDEIDFDSTYGCRAIIYDVSKEDIKYSNHRNPGNVCRDNSLNDEIIRIVNLMENTMERSNLCNLIESCKNIVFNGAPGTGKTFLAKQLAEHIIKENIDANISVSPLEILKDLLRAFQIDQVKREEDNRLLKEFREKFPLKDIKKMTLDDYCIGTGEPNNFCWYLETKLRDQGIFSPGLRGSIVYGIYWSKKDENYKSASVLTGSPDDNLKVVLECIDDCIKNKSDINKLTEIGKRRIIDSGLILKILYSYFPDEFIQINSKTHLRNIVSLFSLQCDDTSNVFELERSLRSLFNDQKKKLKLDITPLEFMRIIYSNFNVVDGEIIKANSAKTIDYSKYISLVQFHQSYDYTDFVEGLRPIPSTDSNTPQFARKNGVFKDFCARAAHDPNGKYVFIIDEINRGEASKIFGELFFCIDPGYRGEKGRVRTQYQNLINDEDPFKEGFFVPNNVYIIGTMNDIDRSVDSLDFAFRRRFNWIEITADESQAMFDDASAWKNRKGEICGIPSNIVEIRSKMDKLNEAIANPDFELGKDYQIGAAYFLKYSTYLDGDSGENKKKAFDMLWKYNIEPLLREYLRGTGFSVESFKQAYYDG